MAIFSLTPIDAATAAGKPNFNTGVSMVGKAGDDFACGHCGRVIIQNYDRRTAPKGVAFVCAACGGANVFPEDH